MQPWSPERTEIILPKMIKNSLLKKGKNKKVSIFF